MLNRLKELREEKGYSLEKLANILHVSKSTLSRIENDKLEPRRSLLEDYAKVFNVTVDYILGLTDNAKLNVRDEKNISKDLKNIMDDFRSGESGPVFYDGIELDEEDMDKLEIAMKTALEIAKVKNKEKYTPKKYKKNKEDE